MLLGLGVISPIVVEQFVRRGAQRTHTALLLLAILGIGLHSALDGYVAADTLTSLTPVRGIVLWQAFIGGALLHVATHPLPDTDLARPAPAWFEGASALLGIALLGALLVGGRFAAAHAQADAVGAALWRLALESAPAVLLAYVVVGLLRGSLPQSSLAWLGRGRPLIQTGKGMVVGLPLPICSCGVVPIYESLIRAGARLLLP